MGDRAESGAAPLDGERSGPSGRTERRGAPAWLLDSCARPWSCFGGLALVCLALQVVTGLLLAFSYRPTPGEAYASVYYLSNVMPYGWLVRTVHFWGSQLVIALAALHAVRMLVNGSYRRPERTGWIVGALALAFVIALAFTGSLLTWDQSAYWSTFAAVSLLREVPLVGEWVARGLLGVDAALGAAALTRFYAAHLTLLPVGLAGLLVAHARIERARGADAMPSSSDAPDAQAGRPLGVDAPSYPDVVASAATMVVLLLCLYAVLAIFLPAPLDVRADPTVTPAAVKPAWYFLSVYALTRYLPPAVAVTVPVVLGMLFILLPFFDRGPSRASTDRALALAVGLSAIAGAIVLTLVGALS